MEPVPPGVPDRVVKRAGDLQSGPVTEPLPTRLQVEVQDSAGDPLAHAPLTWSPCGRGGTVVAVDSVTGPDGRAGATWVLGTSTGLRSVTVRAADRQVVFNATALPGPPHRLVTVAGDEQTGPTGQRLPERLRFQALDAHENPAAGAPVAWEVLAGGGRIEAADPVTDYAGMAGAYWVPGPGGDQRVEARAGDAATTFTATATAP